jgi:hypothetical protein
MKVHFGGSGTGIKRINMNYLQIRMALRKLGCTLTRDWLNPSVDKKTPSREVAFRETIKAINNADAVILEGTYDTSSVGKQLMLALNLELPVLILYFQKLDGRSSLDKFIDKDSTKLVKRAVYTEKTLESKLTDFLDWAGTNTKIVRFNLELERRLDNYLKDKARRNKTSKSEEIRNLILKDLKDNTDEKLL